MTPGRLRELITELRELTTTHGDNGTAAFLLNVPIDTVHELAPCICGKGPSQPSPSEPSPTSPSEGSSG